MKKPIAPLIIFDFDGVLADSFGAVFALNRDCLAQRKKQLTEEGYRRLFSVNVHRGLRVRFGDSDAYEAFMQCKRSRFAEYYRSVGLFPLVAEAVRALRSRATLAIVSAGSRREIERLLRRDGLRGCFAGVSATAAESKAAVTRRYAARFGRGRNVVFVSDTAGDLRMARVLGIKTAAVLWGFHGRKALLREQPDFVLRTPRAIRSLPVLLAARRVRARA